MSEVRLVIQDLTGAKWGDFHGSIVSRVVASLSAEPETIGETAEALERFENHGQRLLTQGLRSGFKSEPWDAGLVMIDLPGRLIAYESSYDHFGSAASVCYHNGSSATGLNIRYKLPSDWLIIDSLDQWPRHIPRREERLSRIARNPRALIYGDELYNFVIERCFSSEELRQHLELQDPSSTYEFCKKLHIQWLQTPQAALGDLSPREYMVSQIEEVDSNLWSRQEQWGLTSTCPQPRSENCFAYEHGPMGSQEYLVYQYMMEFLLERCVVRLEEIRNSKIDWDLFSERARLKNMVNEWRDTLQDDFRNRSPAYIIDMERKLVPMTLSREETIIDCDCPLCNLMADLPGPAFWGLDGSGLPMEFEFSTMRTEQEWKEFMLADFELDRPAESDAQIRLGSGVPGGGNALAATMVAPNTSLMALISVGFSLSDLLVKVEEVDPKRNYIASLNRHFDNLRAVVLEQGEHMSMVAPVLEKFEDSLQELRQEHPQLSIDCDEVSTMLAALLEFVE